MSTLFLKILIKNLKRFKSDIIRSTKLEIHVVPQALHGQFMASAMQMPVKTQTDFIFFQKFQNLPAFIAFISGWIVQKNRLVLLPCRLQ